MTPGLTTLNLPHGAFTDTEPISEPLLRQRATADQPHIDRGQLRQTMPFATRMVGMTRIPPATRNSVVNIVELRPDTQMSWLNADGPVTTVQNIQAIGDRPDEDLMTDPMGEHLPPACVVANHAVTVIPELADPVPARLIDPPSTRRVGWLTGHEPAKCLGRCLTFWALFSQRVVAAMAAHPHVMRMAHATSMNASSAILDRAGLHMTHNSRWVA